MTMPRRWDEMSVLEQNRSLSESLRIEREKEHERLWGDEWQHNDIPAERPNGHKPQFKDYKKGITKPRRRRKITSHDNYSYNALTY